MISQASIEELQQILKEEYGADLPLAQVADLAGKLVGFYSTLAEIYLKDREAIDSP